MANNKLKHIASTQKRLTEQYKSCLTTRNTIIDMFDREFNRHAKLVFGNIINKNNIELIRDKYRPTKDAESNISINEAIKEIINGYPSEHDLRISLKSSLKKSRNMKKIQGEMDAIKTRIRAAQNECKNKKKLYIATQSAFSDKGVVSLKDTEEYKKSIRMIDKFGLRNEQRAKTSN